MEEKGITELLDNFGLWVFIAEIKIQWLKTATLLKKETFRF